MAVLYAKGAVSPTPAQLRAWKTVHLQSAVGGGWQGAPQVWLGELFYSSLLLSLTPSTVLTVLGLFSLNAVVRILSVDPLGRGGVDSFQKR